MLLSFGSRLVDGRESFPFHHCSGVQAHTLDLGVGPLGELGRCVGWWHVYYEDITFFVAIDELINWFLVLLVHLCCRFFGCSAS